MKEFDWEFCKKSRSPKVYNWLFKNHDKPITQEQYVEEMQNFRSSRKGRGYEYSPSSLKYSYKMLKAKFEFFNPLTP